MVVPPRVPLMSSENMEDFGFPTELIREGRVEIAVPKLEAFVTLPSDYAPSKAPVFYNPTMELNRDIAVLALQAYQKRLGEEIYVCEPLAGCGLRGIRFAKEVDSVKKVLLNDLNPKAAKLANFNVKLNRVSKRVVVENDDANLILSTHAAPRKRFSFIDLDPFGSPAPYMDSAVRALRNGGMIALTATDLAPLCGVHPKACIRKYGARPLRTEYCHELAVRILAASLARAAAKHDVGVKMVFAHSTDHYIRVYAVSQYGARKADETLQNLGYIVHCFNCFHRETSKEMFRAKKEHCTECDGKLSVAGPLWLGKIADKSFCESMVKEIDRKFLGQKKKVKKLVSTVLEETEAPATYYVVDEVCDKLGLCTPSAKKVIAQLQREGYQAVATHFRSNGIKTNALAKHVIHVIKSLASECLLKL